MLNLLLEESFFHYRLIYIAYSKGYINIIPYTDIRGMRDDYIMDKIKFSTVQKKITLCIYFMFC